MCALNAVFYVDFKSALQIFPSRHIFVLHVILYRKIAIFHIKRASVLPLLHELKKSDSMI